MPPEFQNPVRAVAAADYAPALVAVDLEAIAKLDRPEGLESLGPSLADEMGREPGLFVPYFIVMDVLNYRFFSHDEQGKFVRYEHNGNVGALAMQSAFLNAWRMELARVPPTFSPLERSCDAAARMRDRIAMAGITSILGPIPGPEEREALLLEVLDPPVLAQLYERISAAANQAGSLGWQEAQWLAEAFPLAYRDDYLKKAQLTMMMIGGQWSAVPGAAPLTLDVSAAADYQLPRVLRRLGLLTYAPALASAIDTGKLIPKGSAEERALRSATIIACDALAAHFDCTVAQVDFWLWLNRNSARDDQFHLTYTTDY